MLKKYHGGADVKGGFYWHTAQWEIVTVEGKRGRLPGEACAYVRVPTLLFIPFALTLGALYYVFLPFIGFAMLFSLIGRTTGRGLRAVVTGLVGLRSASRTTQAPAREPERTVQALL